MLRIKMSIPVKSHIMSENLYYLDLCVKNLDFSGFEILPELLS